MHLLIASILPVFIILVYFYIRDKYEKEPLNVLLLAFFGGVLSVGSTLIINLFIPNIAESADSVASIAFGRAFYQAAIPEEISKFIFLYWFIWKNKNFNEYYDGIIYAVFVSLGFACVENILYVFQNGMGNAIARAFTAVPAHALFGVIMGYYFSLARFKNTNRLGFLITGILLAIVAHGLYDFILFLFHPEIGGLASLFLTVCFFALLYYLYRFCLKRINWHLEKSIFKGH